MKFRVDLNHLLLSFLSISFPEIWSRVLGSNFTQLGLETVLLPHAASSATAGGGDGAGDPQVGENPFQSILSFLIRDHS